MSKIRRLVLFLAAADALGALPGTGPTVTIYRGEIPDPTTVPLLPGPGGAPDPSGRIAPYLVLDGGVGNPFVEPDVADTADELDWTLHALCVAGHVEDCYHLVDRVHARLFRAELTHDDVVVGRLAPPPGYDPGPPRRIDTVKPVRFEVPLQYRLVATAD
ncbi:hypothetical protein [Nocardioides sp. LML1-1-1.1]|uniref:hypothetical protein n=1 Tax=Nocardioides sp. LML1-1-1.1 TaxID=3135248 RepID=UPI00343AFB4F